MNPIERFIETYASGTPKAKELREVEEDACRGVRSSFREWVEEVGVVFAYTHSQSEGATKLEAQLKHLDDQGVRVCSWRDSKYCSVRLQPRSNQEWVYYFVADPKREVVTLLHARKGVSKGSGAAIEPAVERIALVRSGVRLGQFQTDKEAR